MKKEDFSDVFLYTTIVDDDTVYVDKNVLHVHEGYNFMTCLLYTSPSPRD